MRALLVTVALALGLTGCADGDGEDAGGDGAEPSSASSSTVAFDQELHDELVAMLEEDQQERTGGGGPDDSARTERLKEIVAEHGWPTISLVGEDGEDAAWAIAQHSDLDPQFQQRALELLREAVEQGEASPGNLAYLTDRVAAGRGEPQVYGTQIGCTPDGPSAAPIQDEADVDQRRAEVGLEPLADYLAELEEICAEAP